MPSYSKQVPILGRLLKLHDPYGIPLSRVFGHEANDVDVPSDPGSLPVEKTGLTCATGRYMLLLVPGASLANFCFFEFAVDHGFKDRRMPGQDELVKGPKDLSPH